MMNRTTVSGTQQHNAINTYPDVSPDSFALTHRLTVLKVWHVRT